MTHCHFIYYYSPQAVVCVFMSGMRGVDGSCTSTTNPPVWECLIEESNHSQGKISNDTNALKTHLFHDPSVARLWYNTTLQYFLMWNTTDSSVKEIYANYTTACYSCLYHHVWWVVFHLKRVAKTMFEPPKYLAVRNCGKLQIRLKREIFRMTELSKIASTSKHKLRTVSYVSIVVFACKH